MLPRYLGFVGSGIVCVHVKQGTNSSNGMFTLTRF